MKVDLYTNEDQDEFELRFPYTKDMKELDPMFHKDLYLFHTFEAESYFDLMTQMHDFLNWETYEMQDEREKLPFEVDPEHLHLFKN